MTGISKEELLGRARAKGSKITSTMSRVMSMSNGIVV
jgi:hypothetical protein